MCFLFVSIQLSTVISTTSQVNVIGITTLVERLLQHAINWPNEVSLNHISSKVHLMVCYMIDWHELYHHIPWTLTIHFHRKCNNCICLTIFVVTHDPVQRSLPHFLAGCYPSCPDETPFLDEPTMTCVNQLNCSCYVGDQYVAPGASITYPSTCTIWWEGSILNIFPITFSFDGNSKHEWVENIQWNINVHEGECRSVSAKKWDNEFYQLKLITSCYPWEVGCSWRLELLF